MYQDASGIKFESIIPEREQQRIFKERLMNGNK